MQFAAKWVCYACPKFWKFLPECTVQKSTTIALGSLLLINSSIITKPQFQQNAVCQWREPVYTVLSTKTISEQMTDPIDRFQVSHFRPVVMEIEIGGRSEKSLGGQESAAVDQECMGSNASSCSFALSFPIWLLFFLPEPVSCRGQRIARRNGKRNRSFTKNITTFAAVVEVLILIAMFFFLSFFF